MRTVILAGEPLPRALVERALRAAAASSGCCNLYGPTEDTTYSTCAAVERGRRGGSRRSAGRSPAPRVLRARRAACSRCRSACPASSTSAAPASRAATSAGRS